MARPKTKNGKALNLSIDIEIANMLDEYSKKTGVTKTRTVEFALMDYFEKYKMTAKKPTESV